MSSIVRPINDNYRGLCCGFPEPKVVLGERRTTTGYLWWKKVEVEEVWLVVHYKTEYSCTGVGVDSDNYWVVLKAFHRNNKDIADKWLEDYKGES
tara:strand:+ start:49853 stop:50137 length:285 start_codon:yes stop_codon:yes gene_type:complete